MRTQLLTTSARRALLSTINGQRPEHTSASSIRAKHTLPDMPYDYNALEPAISAEIMRLHHQKHHATYVNNLNVAEEKLSEAMVKNDLKTAIGLQQAIRFNGGGHLNHSIFWQILSPNGGGDPPVPLRTAIDRDFGGFDDFTKTLSSAALAIQGSGWAWLGLDKSNGRLTIRTCANQDPLEPTTGLAPLFGIDMWEHAFYLQYKNVKADYVREIFNVANWEEVDRRLRTAESSR